MFISQWMGRLSHNGILISNKKGKYSWYMRYMDESQKGYAELKKRHSGKDRNLRKRNQKSGCQGLGIGKGDCRGAAQGIFGVMGILYIWLCQSLQDGVCFVKYLDGTNKTVNFIIGKGYCSKPDLLNFYLFVLSCSCAGSSLPRLGFL